MIQGEPELATLFEMGLVAFLEPRERDGISQDRLDSGKNGEWVVDTDRDEAAKDRWSIFLVADKSAGLDDVICDGYPATNTLSGTQAGFRNATRTIKDSWHKIIHYESDPPYLSYRLWSDGPTDAPEDDLHKDTWDN